MTRSATNLVGRHEGARRGAFPSQAAARQARNKLPAATTADRTAEGWTVERWPPASAWVPDQHPRDVETVLIHYLVGVDHAAPFDHGFRAVSPYPRRD